MDGQVALLIRLAKQLREEKIRLVKETNDEAIKYVLDGDKGRRDVILRKQGMITAIEYVQGILEKDGVPL